MSIVTKSGDRGKTALMFNRQVSKCHPRVEACGTVDELNAAIGVARAAVADARLRQRLEAVQHELVLLMGELATAAEDVPRYAKAGHSPITSARVAALEEWIAQIEQAEVVPKGWVMPGANTPSAAFDLARTVCRRAERRVCALQEARQLENETIIIYLNRLSDLLWLLARQAEA